MMYANPRRIKRNGEETQVEQMLHFSFAARQAVEKGDDIGARLWSTKAFHAMKLSGTAAVKAFRKERVR